MKERIKLIRKDSGLNQKDFGSRISITKSSVSLLESGRNNPSDQTVQLICREFNISEEWLRTGIGIMHNQTSALNLAYNHFGYMMKNSSAQKKAVLTALVEMAYYIPEDKWNYIVEQFNNCMIEANKKKEEN